MWMSCEALKVFKCFKPSDRTDVAPPPEGVTFRIVPSSGDMKQFRRVGDIANHKGHCPHNRHFLIDLVALLECSNFGWQGRSQSRKVCL